MFDWITGLVQGGGYIAIALLMLAENLFPPIPSELIMPLAGFTAARGELNIFLVVLAGTVGTVLGALFWYFVARRIGRDRLRRWTGAHGRWITLSSEDVDRATGWFERHGRGAVFFCHFVPAVRTLISIPAGIAAMPLPSFIAFTAAGTAIWCGFLAGLGYVLEDGYEKVEAYLNPVSNVVMGGLVLLYIYRVVTFRSRED
ncbi:DedA family protein [Roseomonas sp. SSH11]|uniref:DedA family protein n=1 Tax=Pararoseomonas baculiformis TaxID=2820812 RepID=A0ABS4AGG4_9PROT|nr:DedA family protein [Pararoseomonas baculiformis]MBP0446114.1 DedA family protein [Pararoseomonas baculiformis]